LLGVGPNNRHSNSDDGQDDKNDRDKAPGCRHGFSSSVNQLEGEPTTASYGGQDV